MSSGRNAYRASLHVGLFLLLVVGFVFCRWHHFHDAPLLGDECAAYSLSLHDLSTYFGTEKEQAEGSAARPLYKNLEVNGLFYYKCLQRPYQRFCARHNCTDTDTLRLSSLGAAVLVLAGVFVWGRGREPGLAAVALLVGNGLFAYYANILRYNMCNAAAAVLCTLLLLICLERPRPWMWLLYSLSMLVCFFTHISSAAILPAHWAYAWLCGRKRPELRRQLLWLIPAWLLACLLAYIPFRLLDPEAGQRIFFYPRPNLSHWYNTWLSLVGRRNYPFSALTISVSLLYGAATVWGLLLSWRRGRAMQGKMVDGSGAARPFRSVLVLVGLVAVSAPLLLQIASLLFTPVILARNLIFLLPFLAYLQGTAWCDLARRLAACPNWLKALPVFLLFLLIPVQISSCRLPVNYEWCSLDMADSVPLIPLPNAETQPLLPDIYSPEERHSLEADSSSGDVGQEAAQSEPN